MKLSSSDVESFHRTLLALHEERDLDAFREAVPGIAFGLIPARQFMWMEAGFGTIDDPLRNMVFWESPPRTTPALLSRLMRHLRDHPFSAEHARSGSWGPFRLSDFWTDAELRASRIHREVYRHNGIGRLISKGGVRGNRPGTINLCRPLSEPDFTPRDRDLLGLFHSHFLQALGAAERVSARQEDRARMLATIGLTPREVEVACWLGRGRTNVEIASILGTRQRTVEKHVERILEKLGVENRTAAASVIAGSARVGGG